MPNGINAEFKLRMAPFHKYAYTCHFSVHSRHGLQASTLEILPSPLSFHLVHLGAVSALNLGAHYFTLCDSQLASYPQLSEIHTGTWAAVCKFISEYQNIFNLCRLEVLNLFYYSYSTCSIFIPHQINWYTVIWNRGDRGGAAILR